MKMPGSTVSMALEAQSKPATRKLGGSCLGVHYPEHSPASGAFWVIKGIHLSTCISSRNCAHTLLETGTRDVTFGDAFQTPLPISVRKERDN